MVSAFSPNIQLEEPARGDQVGTWDTPVNNNMTLIDSVVGNITTISLNNSPVVLSSPQFQSKTIIFNSTLTGNVSITFPSTFKKTYEIYHTCTGSSAFVITLQTTVAGGEAICAAPGTFLSVINDGTNIRYTSLERIGTYWDYTGSSVPNWVTACTKPPYLACDGTAFSSAVYPVLCGILNGSNTLPDLRGRVRAYVNNGTSRMLSSNGGVDGNALFSAGGADTHTLTQGEMPQHTHGASDSGHTHATFVFRDGTAAGGSNNSMNGGGSGTASGITFTTAAGSANINVSNTGGGNQHTIMQPTTVGGVAMIRAA